jgi:hypothetical protein
MHCARSTSRNAVKEERLMAQDIEEPLHVRHTGEGRETLVRSDFVHIGRGLRPGDSMSGRFPVLDPTELDAESDVIADPESLPTLPDAILDVGDDLAAGGVTVRATSDAPVITLDGSSGFGTFGTGRGHAGGLVVRAETNGPVILVTGQTGRITFLNTELETTLAIDAVSGDIEFHGADCAEDFDVAEPLVPGSVACIDDNGRLTPCNSAYDRRAVGVVSGAGGLRPALRLHRRPEAPRRLPVAISGKVTCLVDAELGAVRVGDMLTTSPTRGHAMLASEMSRAFGAVIGKSLGSQHSGRGLVPMLVTLQ